MKLVIRVWLSFMRRVIGSRNLCSLIWRSVVEIVVTTSVRMRRRLVRLVCLLMIRVLLLVGCVSVLLVMRLRMMLFSISSLLVRRLLSRRKLRRLRRSDGSKKNPYPLEVQHTAWSILEV